eukprot:Skav222990  [mRNA]  locus=scaffold1827:227767:229841:- [translate_table: standard]
MITISTYCEHHKEAICHVLGADCRVSGALAYILTLGVAEHFRRRGLASELIRRSVEHVEQQMPNVQAVFLHVVTYNAAAIELYEASEFLRIEYFPRFYFLHGNLKEKLLRQPLRQLPLRSVPAWPSATLEMAHATSGKLLESRLGRAM